MSEPILIPIRRLRMVVLATGMGALTMVCLGFCALALFSTPVLFGMFCLTLICAGIFGALSVLLGGIAIKAPLALRMDQHGISGFYAEPTLWHEIKDIAVVETQVNVAKNPSRHRHLGFALRDPVGFRDRQTPWRRFTSWSNGRAKGYHIVVPEIVLRGTSAEALVTQAKAMHAAATDPFDPHNLVT